MNQSPIRLGILGCGSFIQRRILPYLHEVNDIKVTCIQKRDLKAAKEVASQFSIPYAVSTREDLLNHPEVDAIYIATRNHLHEEDALACAQAKKPTLCEKPLAPTLKAIQRMLKAFKETSTPFFVGHSLRFKPSIQKAKELLSQGKLGALLEIKAYFTISVPEDSWKLKKEYAGGALQDIGIHLIDLIHFITSEKITSLYTMAKVDEVDTAIFTLCRLANLGFATFECSFEGPVCSGFEVVGTKGRLISTESLRQILDPIETLCLIQEDNTTIYLPLKASNIYVDELKHFARVLRGNQSPLISAEIGLENQKVLEAAVLSFSQNREVIL